MSRTAYSHLVGHLQYGYAGCRRGPLSRGRNVLLAAACMLPLFIFGQASLHACTEPLAPVPSLNRSPEGAGYPSELRQSPFRLSASAALALGRVSQTPIGPLHSGVKAAASSNSQTYVVCMDAAADLMLCPLTAAQVPQLSYSSLSGLPTIPTAVASLTRNASDYANVYVTAAEAEAAARVQSVNGQTGSITGLATAVTVPAVAQLARSAADYQSTYDAYGAASLAQAASIPLSNDVEVFAGSYPPQKSDIVGNQHVSTALNAVLDGGINSQILDGGMMQLFNNVTQQKGTRAPTLPVEMEQQTMLEASFTIRVAPWEPPNISAEERDGLESSDFVRRTL